MIFNISHNSQIYSNFPNQKNSLYHHYSLPSISLFTASNFSALRVSNFLLMSRGCFGARACKGCWLISGKDASGVQVKMSFGVQCALVQRILKVRKSNLWYLLFNSLCAIGLCMPCLHSQAWGFTIPLSSNNCFRFRLSIYNKLWFNTQK